MSKRIAIYPGTFDPFTLGHEDLVRRASRLFEKVVVGIAVSKSKLPYLSLEQRKAIVSEVIQPYDNVSVCSFEGLLMDFLHEQGGNIILRGLRAISDFEYEFQLAGMNRRLHPDVETIFLTPGEQYMFVSATMVREIAALGGNIEAFVRPEVARLLRQKLAQG